MLRAPDGQVLLFRAFAQGTQVYECLPGGGAWTSVSRWPRSSTTPGATSASTVAGPSGAPTTASRVVGATQASAPARDPAQDVSLLLLRATANSGEGRFAAVNFIQRLDTRGGAAPAGPCDPAVNSILEVPYHAVYYFYGDRAAA